MSKSNWIFERSSGYAGFRCHTCATWVYAEAPRECKCNDVLEPIPEAVYACELLTLAQPTRGRSGTGYRLATFVIHDGPHKGERLWYYVLTVEESNYVLADMGRIFKVKLIHKTMPNGLGKATTLLQTRLLRSTDDGE